MKQQTSQLRGTALRHCGVPMQGEFCHAEAGLPAGLADDRAEVPADRLVLLLVLGMALAIAGLLGPAQ